MAEDRAKALLQRQAALASERSTAEAHWQEIAELFTPFRADFQGRLPVPGEKRQMRLFDGTPGQASENLSSALWGMLTNAANVWFELRPRESGLSEDHAVKAWLEQARDRMLAAFAAGGQRFYARAVDLYSDLVNFGTGIFYEEEAPDAGGPGSGSGAGIHFSCRHLAECYIAENQYEQVDTVFRRFRWTARQAMQRWPESGGAKLKESAERRPDATLSFLHAVLPAADYEGASPLAHGQGWWSVYLGEEDGNVLSEGGYHEFPYQVPRWSQRSRSVYGDSPAMLALPDAKMLNQMCRTTIAGAQKRVDPPLLAPDEASVRGIRTAPGGVIYGGIDPQGRRLYEPLVTGGELGLGLQMEEQRRQAVREAFYASLLLLANQPGRTATEVLALQEEKLRLMGPHLGRVQSEFLDPLIGRVFGILLRAGALPPVPPALREAPALDVAYVSPMSRAQRSGEAVAVLRTMELAGGMAALDPGVVDNLDGDQAFRIAAEANGLPASALRTPEQVVAVREQRQAMQALAAGAQLAPGVAKATRDFSEAATTAAEAAP
jgi:hypothetical protein